MMLPQQTIRYKTYIKKAFVEALQSVFSQHPDELLSKTKIRIDFSFEETDYPAIIVRYYGRDFVNAGIGHHDVITDPITGNRYKGQRRIYHGDMEFAIYGLSSLDRDLIADALLQVLAMPETANYTNYFLSRIYSPKEWEQLQGLPAATTGNAHLYHFLNVNNDVISEFGESQVPAPWMPEDVLLYQTSQRVPIMGEVLSLPPEVVFRMIQRVRAFPYIGGLEPVPAGTVDSAIWIPG